uniref:acyl-CoA desaturase n=1 Tax=uncultured Psychrobacter sp. TaxID=259303 RepID=UPI00260C4BD1|nr:fatty acid desaturase [uncultured Psychrobacter sp.]
MIAKKVIGLPLKGLRLAMKSGDTLIQNAGTQALRVKTWFDNNKSNTNAAAETQFAATSGYKNANSAANYEGVDPLELEFQKSPINLVPAIFLIATPIAAAVITPWYLLTHEVSAPVWGVFGAFMVWTGLSITAGYHRLLSHRAYKAHPIVKNFLLLGSTLAVQGSAFDWVSGHRSHHRHVDDRMEDPYSAQRGFFFSHIGWMLRNYPSGRFDYKNIPDLTKDKVLQIQHKYYGLWVLATNVAMVAAVGWLIGDVWGTLVLAGLLRLVLTHHFTFFINSLCHMFGTRPYTDTNSARDNFFLAIFTWGEGYHNYHHFFQYDYRNGVKWWQYDPTKWLIAGLSKIGLTSELRTVDDTTIKHAEVQMQFKRAQQQIDKATSAGLDISQAMQNFQDRIKLEYDAFKQTVEEWKALKAKAVEMKKTDFADRLHEVDDKLKHEYTKVEQKIFEHNNNLKTAFRSIGFNNKAA